jgi:hypothetical protein
LVFANFVAEIWNTDFYCSGYNSSGSVASNRKGEFKKTEDAKPAKIGRGTWVLAGIAIILFFVSLLLQGKRLYGETCA